ncbi:anaerobic dimethyl sulfoxide reductase chain A [Photobacterium aphoticum]|uniref:Anaerobic dimethyl sulfoxide reductase chain A n=1 Tax=Photobacterium aphoticum TaxID=754436 RepID=A0A090QNA5_9GAMM|nr:anaerobic dimethyl sulfoxide reductase chain A [Photobacterium aphoticum]
MYLNYGTGTLGGTVTKSWPPGSTLIARLMNLTGGYLNHYGDYSTAQIAAGLNYTYGGWANNNSFSDLENTKLIVQFGNNPAETRMSGGGLIHHLMESKARSNAKMIMIDPRYNDTAGGREDQWVPIRPGTDTALVAAIAHVLITENMVDQAFLDTYCVGYDEKTLPASAPANSDYKSYILGRGEDGIEKTPAWASPITGIPVDIIVKLAREIGQAKPCAIFQGWGLQRTANGEIASRAIAMLALLTGNVGINGGGTGARESDYNIPFVRFPIPENPVKTAISMFLWTDAIVRGPEMTATRDGVRGKDKLDVPIKFIWNYAGNCLINQHSDINRTHDILQDDSACEMIVVIDNHMTSSAKYADIVLPDLTTSEQADFCMDTKAANMPYFIFADKAIEPQFEARGIYEICTELAKRLGVEEAFTEGRDQEGWLRHLYKLTRDNDPSLPDYETVRKLGIVKRNDPNGHYVAYKAFRDDPQANPLSTPSGKIEIYSERLATIAQEWELPEGDVIHPLPVHVSTAEGWDDPMRSKYPLQLTGFHYKARCHSTYGNVDIIKEAARQEMWINRWMPKNAGSKTAI